MTQILPTLTPDVVEGECRAAETFLLELIRFRSYSGREDGVAAFLIENFGPLVDRAEQVPLSDEITQDPEYSTVIPDLSYEGRFNVRLTVGDGIGGRTLLFNTHFDVVPESKGQTNAFNPLLEADVVYGRGACDAKGQIACLYLALRLLHRLGRRPTGTVVVHLVVEEENGGNGTLAMVRSGDHADAAVVLEPTGGRIVRSVRGAVWFRVICEGRAAHSGSHLQAVSALKCSIEAMEIIERCHRSLWQRSRGLPLFDEFQNPMPLTFGRLRAGNWPASTPDAACLEGVFGFLPNTSRTEVMSAINASLRADAWDWLRQHHTLDFMYRHDPHQIPEDHPLVRSVSDSCEAAGVQPQLAALPASCDSWFYNNLLGIPTVVYGPGHLATAHSADERLNLRELRESACVLACLMAKCA